LGRLVIGKDDIKLG